MPTGYEIILRAAEVKGINYESFQDDFDLDKDRKPDELHFNSFGSVANAINQKYPFVSFTEKTFDKGDGNKKIKFIEDIVSQKIPLLISLSQPPYNKNIWHTFLVVAMNEKELILYGGMFSPDQYDIRQILKSEIIRIHDEYEGGKDVAFLIKKQK